MKLRLLAITFMISLATAAPVLPQSVESEAVAREEYAVYSALLRTIQDSSEYHPSLWVIANPTTTRMREFVSKKYVQSVPPGTSMVSDEVFQDYSQRNKGNRWLERRFDVDFKYVLADEREIKELLDEGTPLGEWKGFKDKYPTAVGFITLSRVGLNARLDEALVFASWSCGPLCGYGELFMLVKKDNQWNVSARVRLYVS
jgi:hypothetical protein